MEVNISQSPIGFIEDGPPQAEVPNDIWQISDEMKRAFMTINMVVICSSVSLFGICSNIINIMVFVRQGFKETINWTLLALAISDLGSLITMLWKSICHNPALLNTETALLPEEIQYITGLLPHVIFVRITGWLTAFLTAERCFCVLFPLKVKSIFMPTRNKTIIALIYVILLATVSPFYAAIKLGWKFVPDVNTTMLGLVYHDNSVELLGIGHTLIGLPSSLPFSIIVVTSTLILVISLKRQTKWRLRTAGSKKSSVTKEKAVIKMVIAIATILIVCLLIPSLVNIPLTIFPEFNIAGKYSNLFLVIDSFLMVLEGINSSINIFVYYNMSSNYRYVLREIFLRRKMVS